MKVLVLGGTRFFGKHAVIKMLERGYAVTLLTRGRTKDEFGDQVRRLYADRTNEDELKKALEDLEFDVVLDNICYVSSDIKSFLDVMKGRIKRYIVTSSLAVYQKEGHLKEEDFNPYIYPIVYGNRFDFTYAEGKRLVEAELYQNHTLPAVAVRFPIVVGENDYTNRFRFYIEHIKNGEAFGASNIDKQMSFISEEDAGAFLCALVESEYIGPINGASLGSISVRALLECIEDKVGKKAVISPEIEEGPYSHFMPATLDVSRTCKIYNRLSNIEMYFKNLLSIELK